MRVEIFKTGTHTDSAGNTRTWTEKDLDTIVSKYNPAEHEAPVVIGHPVDNAPAYGWVEKLERRGQSLWAKIKPTVQEFVDWVKAGLYKKVSISLYPDLRLRHVGFLGAMPPAVKGLTPVQFSDREYAEYEFREWTTEEREKLAKGLIKGEFAGPDRTFPIASPEDVADAFRLAGHADDPDEVRRNIIRIAKKYGWTDALPESAKKWAEEHNIELKEARMEELKELGLKLKEQEELMKEYKEREIQKDEEIAKLKERIRMLEMEKKRAEFESFCEGLIREGRLTPAVKPVVIDFMEILSQVGEFEFSEPEGKLKTEPLEKFKSFLRGLPKQVEFGEVATKDIAVEAKGSTKDLKDLSGWDLLRIYRESPQEFTEILEKSRNK